MRVAIIILFVIASLQAMELGWSDNYDEALAQAKKEHKLVYTLITSSTCGWCRKFEKTTLQDTMVKKRLTKEFITVQLTRDFDTIPKEFKTSPVPRHYFTDSNGKILYSSLGYRKVECFDSFMDNAQEKYEINLTKKDKK